MGISDFEFKVRELHEGTVTRYRNSIPRKAVDELIERIIKTFIALQKSEDNKTSQTTKADRIRALTDEELAKLIQVECPPTGIDACAETCTACWLRWLQQPVDAIVLEDLCAKSEIKLQEENDNE